MTCSKCNQKKKKAAGIVEALRPPLYTVGIGAWSGEKIAVIVQSKIEIQAVRFQKVLDAGTQIKLYPQELESLMNQNAPVVAV